MEEFNTYYDVLKIDEAASQEAAREAYRRLAKEYHPDTLAVLDHLKLDHLKGVRELAAEKFREINEAWDVIGKPERRREYDLELRRLRGDSAEPPPSASSASSSAYQAPPHPSPTASRASPPPGGHASAGPRASAQPSASGNTGTGHGQSIVPGWMWLVAIAFIATLIAFKVRQEDRRLGVATESSQGRSKSVEGTRGTPGQSVEETRGTPESPTTSPSSSQEQSKLVEETATNGLWRDPSTGLLWAGKDNGADHDPSSHDDDLDWKEAQSYCQNLDLGGHQGWRLPTASELLAIFDPTVTYTHRVLSAPSPYHIKGGIRLSGASWSAISYGSEYAWQVPFFGPLAARRIPQKSQKLVLRALCVYRPGEDPGVHEVDRLREEAELQSREDAYREATDRVRAQTVKDGYWKDPSTGLAWANIENGPRMTFGEATGFCENLKVGGLSGWHLPTMEEIKGIFVPDGAVDGTWAPAKLRGELRNPGQQWTQSGEVGWCLGSINHNPGPDCQTEGRPAGDYKSGKALCVTDARSQEVYRVGGGVSQPVGSVATPSTPNTSAATAKPSFNCRFAATPTEKLICRDTALASAEVQMVSLHNQLLGRLSESDAAAFRAEHMEWFKNWSGTCNAIGRNQTEPELRACVTRFLAARIQQLEVRVRRLGPK